MSVSSAFCKFTSDSSPSPRLAFIGLFVCACVFTIMLFTENLWQADGERVHHRLPLRYMLRTKFSFLRVWPFFAGPSLVLLVLLVTVTNGLVFFAACPPVSTPRKFIFLLLCAPLASSHLFFIMGGKKINHPGPSWRETKEMKYKSNYDIAQLRTLRKTLSSVSFPL